MLRYSAVTFAIPFTTQTFAYTNHTCENDDRSKSIEILFDAADNFFIFAKLTRGSEVIPGVLEGSNRWRPTAANPNRPVQIIDFENLKFSMALDSTAATLTSNTGETESLICCAYMKTCPRL